MERAVILADGDTIHARHLNLALHAPLQPAEAPSPWTSFDFSGSLADVARRAQAEVEKRKIEQALKEAGGQQEAGGGDPRGELQDVPDEAEGLRGRVMKTSIDDGR